MIIEHHALGASGSDISWQMVGRRILKYPIKLISNHHYVGNKTRYGNIEVHEYDFPEGAAAVRRANKTLRRDPTGHMDLILRNWFPVRASDAVFIIGSMQGNTISGDAAWAVQMAIDNGIPVFAFDQHISRWKEYVDDVWKWCICDCPILTKKFAGMGTKVLKPNGLAAIEEIYKKSYTKWLTEI